MGLTNIMGLLGLIGIPIIIILYMLRPKNKPVTIPSLYLWKQMTDDIESATKLKKLKSSILMFIQLFVVLLMSLIFAGLFIKNTDSAEKVLIVVECGYTMGSKDVEGDRMTYAKELIADYIQNLSEGSEVSVLALEEVPRTILKNEVDRNLVISSIDQLQVIDGIGDIELGIETIQLLKEDNQQIVYFGDRKIEGIDQVITVKDTKNFSVHNISYTKYIEEGTLTALTEIYNHHNEKAIIPISLYVDDVFFGAKQIELEANSSGKLFFENIPVDTSELHVQLDSEDILEIDNHAYSIIQSEKVKKVLLVSTSNRFLEKAIRLHPSVELYVTQDMSSSYGYDLYVYDSMIPEDFPRDGNYLIFNPKENDNFTLLGYVENPVFSTNNHKITSLIEKTEFSTRVTGVYEVENPRDIIYNTEFGAGAFETTIYDNKAIVFGFDIHETDLPLSIEFPVLMMNTVDYLLNNQMIESGQIYAADQVVVSIFPNTIQGVITLPDGEERILDISRRELIFSETNQVGTYSITQENKGESLTQRFSVNVPLVPIGQGTVYDGKGSEMPLTSKSLARILGIAVVVFILIEWLIYSYRRRINEYSHK
jgi:hypothetical protein